MRRGIREERELINRLDELGFAVLRSPSSGSRTKLDRPDILAGGKGLYLAIEVKTTSKETLYIESESIRQLVRFSQKFGAKPIVAVKFKHKRMNWLLIEPEELIQTNKGYKITLKQAKKEAKTLESLTTKNLGEYLK